MTKEEWINYGIEQKFISEPDCERHKGFPMTAEEEAEIDEGGDPCFVVMRLFDSVEQFDKAKKHTDESRRD